MSFYNKLVKSTIIGGLATIMCFTSSMGADLDRLSTGGMRKKLEPKEAPPMSASKQPIGADDGQPVDEATLDIQADRLEYTTDRKTLIGTGSVLVRNGLDVLQADYAEYNTETKDVLARGNVSLDQDGTIWEGDELSYNLKTREGDFGEFDLYMEPFYVHAEDSQKVSEDEYVLNNARLTSCDGSSPEFYIKARRARIFHGTTIKASGVVLYLAGLPFMYFPYWKHTIGKDTNWDIVPGYSSRMGAFLLTAYNYRLNPATRAATHFDYRAKRGLGLGQDVIWEDPNDQWSGKVTGYYLDDDDPLEGNDNPSALETEHVDNQRYRVRLQHNHTVTDRDYFLFDASYLSDPNIVEDFFDDEYRESPQPENRASLTHRGDGFTAGILLNTRINDFYENINRLPELSLDINRQEIGDSGLYYESDNSATSLEKVYDDLSSNDDVDVLRVDSSHTLLYPTRHFGFLNLVPRAGYRATYYSDTFQDSATTNTTSGVDTNGVAFTTTNIVNTTIEGGAELRTIFELGLETSFKAFKAWDSQWFHGDEGLRHVVEPFADYTYRPEPSITPDELFQFDSIDGIDESHKVGFGIRNKIQTKRRGRIHDLIDVVVESSYNLDAESDEEPLGDIEWDGELRLWEWMLVDFDGEYDVDLSNLDEFSIQLGLIARDDTSLGVEYRFRDEKDELLSGELVLFPNERWSLGAYGRYEFETGELEEQAYMLTRKSNCLGTGIGVKEIDEDITVWFQLWLAAFPESSVSLGR